MDYDYNKFIQGYDEMMFEEPTTDTLTMRQYDEDRKKFLDGDYSDTDINSMIDAYWDKNAPYSVVLYNEVPPSEDEVTHLKNIMRSLYYTKAGKHVGGAFVTAILESSGESIARADNMCLRALKLFMWFTRNELSGVRDLTEVEADCN
jgi:hypothetical protein